MRTLLLYTAIIMAMVGIAPQYTANAQNRALNTLAEAVDDTLPYYRLYPNPATDYLTIELHNPSVLLVEIYNAQGQLVLGGPILLGKNTINLRNLNLGFYIVRLIQPNGVTTTERFQKQ